MALGASASNIQRFVLGEVGAVLAVGVGAGLVLLAMLKQSLESVAYGVEPADALTVVAVASLTAGVALTACFLPAYRAERSNPARVIGEQRTGTLVLLSSRTVFVFSRPRRWSSSDCR